MFLEVTKEYYEEHLQPLVEGAYAKEKWALPDKRNTLYGMRKHTLDISTLQLEELEGFYQFAKDTENRSMMVQLSPIIRVLKDVENEAVTSLKALGMGLIEYVKKDAINGWLFSPNNAGLYDAYLVKDVTLEQPKTTSPDERPYLRIKVIANSPHADKKGVVYKNITFDSEELQGKTIPQLLAKTGFFKETEHLTKLYEEHLALFEEYRQQYNKQFLANGVVSEWHSGYRYNKMKVKDAKCVNDEEILDREYTYFTNSDFWQKHGVEKGFNQVPIHLYVYLFNLQTHTNMFVHASRLKPYEYDLTLKDKLVLPQEHRDLIDVLVEDLDILMEDIIKGKSGGTTILCTGKPGLGKTLSAEVYSEIIQKPLYKVHSGQLGLSSDKVEKNLEVILKRASRWGAVLLIDEADVYIRQRGNDIQHNAVVASFLRTLEYFDGLLFMTTNRREDVDDAIVSRCIAIIKYVTPSKEDAMRIWSVLSTQYGVDLDYDLVDEVTNCYPDMSGRDIKELLKLATRYSRSKNVPYSMELFRKCAQFRGLEMRK